MTTARPGRLRVLLEITNAIVTNLDTHALFRAIADAISKVLAFDSASGTG